MTLNAKLSNLQLIKLKSWIKNGTGVSLKISSNVVGDSKWWKQYEINTSKIANITLSKT